MLETRAIADHRRIEAERLIEIARQLLNQPEEEIVAIYLDHAVEALRIVAEQYPVQADPTLLAVSPLAMATTADQD
ncbi:hypothetical protein [Sphingomonas nostoxanthinifaciens]|uniref:hypothetical protein n=1 Tax=Sphingomonas nostoxanthinifaciens TaxID=2872652 RepID=UPI001CC1D729|nr:hypothetical protein [Sphingomonas nostoxanthinifaciens]UAK23807.1 hypothetical protein K8P63_15705 [Sphingomonas nostoxanthinifaciens]